MFHPDSERGKKGLRRHVKSTDVLTKSRERVTWKGKRWAAEWTGENRDGAAWLEQK